MSPTPMVPIPRPPDWSAPPPALPANTNISDATQIGISVLFISACWSIAEAGEGVARRRGKTMSDQAPIEPPESFDAFHRRLIQIEPRLPKRLRQAAAYALEHPC